MSIEQQNAIIEKILTDRGLAPKSVLIWKNSNNIIYNFFRTIKGTYAVKHGIEYFNTFGKLHPEFHCEKGDSFDEHVTKELMSGDVLIFANPDGIFEVDYDDFKRVAVRRFNRSSNSYTFSIPINMFRSMN